MIHRAFTRRTTDRPIASASRGHARSGRARAVLTLALLLALAGSLTPGLAIAQDAGAEFAVGDRVAVTAGDGLNVRDAPGETTEVIETLLVGTEATILALPDAGTDDGFTWYQIETDDGLTGWVAGEFIELVAPAEDDGTIPIGSTVIVGTDELNIRGAAGLDTEIIETLPADTEATIDSEPVEADELLWYRVHLGNREIFGWVAGEFLVVTADPPVIALGDMVAVNTDQLTVRDAAGLDGEPIDTLIWGAAATVIDGPVEADGFSWFQIESDEVTGWVAGAWLTVP
jgi:uncharacterized protein YgiM (DUF1202 family)